MTENPKTANRTGRKRKALWHPLCGRVPGEAKNGRFCGKPPFAGIPSDRLCGPPSSQGSVTSPEQYLTRLTESHQHIDFIIFSGVTHYHLGGPTEKCRRVPDMRTTRAYSRQTLPLREHVRSPHPVEDPAPTCPASPARFR